MAELGQSNINRRTIKSKLTRFRTFVETVTENNKTQLPDRISRAVLLLNEFEEIQTNIEDAIRAAVAEENEDEAEIAGREEEFERERRSFEDAYYETLDKARRKLPPTLEQDNNQPQARMQQIQRAEDAVSTNVKLPVLSLPTFNGDYDQWLLFKDSFKSLIHSNIKLSEIQKFQYLRSALKDEALQVLQSLETSAENYEIGWNLLTQRYENKRLIINTHMKELFELTPIQKGSLSALRQFIDTIQTHTRALSSLGQPVDQWDTISIHLLSNRLDFHTRKDWEIHVGNKEDESLPSMKQWIEFLTSRCHTLELVEGTNQKQIYTKPSNHKKDKRVSLAMTSTKCTYCNGSHFIYHCEEFLKLPVQTRQSEITQRQLCINCLKKGHYARDCKSSGCRKCSRQHNTLLHQDRESYKENTAEKRREHCNDEAAKTSKEESQSANISVYCSQDMERPTEETAVENTTVITHIHKKRSQVILSTAQVHVFDSQGNAKKCRVLLDPGSQSNLITTALADKLKLSRKKINIPISGIGQSRSHIKESIQVKLKSVYNNYQATIDCLVLDSITEPLPQVRIDTQSLAIPKDIRLADPNYETPGTIDLLIGAGLFWQLICVGRIETGRHQPILQKTLLGWVLGGESRSEENTTTIPVSCLNINHKINQTLEAFWRIEEVKIKNFLTKEEKLCEQYFTDTVKRNPDGRFIVRLPIDPSVTLGESRSGALRRLYSTEKRLREQPELEKEYTKFLKEYESLGHMSWIKEEEKPDLCKTYYLPHQPVLRANSLTTKLRVVFDGSARTSLRTSLNDKLLTGPNLQEEILDIILRFRCYQYVLTADVAMMFRQIIIAEEDRNLQRILWRADSNEEVRAYTLNTVTYGTSCAPYLAMRCLKQLAVEESTNFPQASKAILQDCYMDDILTGSDTLKEAIELQQQLDNLLKKGKFPLRKWRSNHEEILAHLAEIKRAEELMVLDSGQPLKTLGLLWNAAEDILQYTVSIKQIANPTKRSILSQIAKIYDPLGLLGPILIIAKMIMQELWKKQLAWDESVPQSLYTLWHNDYSSLPTLNQLKIPRNVNPRNTSHGIEIHGFSDASERGYGACIYCIYKDGEGRISSQLSCSKSRVAPLKSLSLPRLELCAATIMARLINIVCEALGNKVKSIHLWTDSTIVLSWVKAQPHTLKTFVANRVAEIQELTTNAVWLHVPTNDNPADLLSRGVPTSFILESNIWWLGPHWLINQEDWPEQPTIGPEDIIEGKTTLLVITFTPPDIIYKFSCYDKLQRVIAYCHRFANNAKGNRKCESLTVEELERANISILRLIQRERFSIDIKQLFGPRGLSLKSGLISLNPFLDEQGLIRVGGRLKNAEIPENQKHPIVLPSKHHITTLIMRREHHKLFHCGQTQLLNSIRQNYWPLSGRREARKITRNCLQCFRFRPTPPKTLMADMPKARLKEFNRPFDRCGVDYAGPFILRDSKKRGRVPTTKAYVAVFVCFLTKAVHIELVSNLTSESFLAALRRFASRRGAPSHIYSDNATNFVGANRELTELYRFLQQGEEEIVGKLATQQITWHFIPPRSPHFGGLWEAAVKSVKKHISIVLKGLTYTYEEYNTFLIEIEAILNSRPLTSLSSDPNDLSPLTPSHFLTGDSLLQPAQGDFRDTPDNRLSRWQNLLKLRAHFWKRWRNEYLSQLQTRVKWTKGKANLRIGSLVLLIEDNSPPLHWPMGRIIEVYPGEDDIVRVVSVKTSSGNFKRAVKKLCVIPEDI